MNFEELLKEHNLKVTPQRMAILHEISQAGHINIEDIYENIRRLYPSMSLATVYKNLTSMQEVDIVREVKIPNQKQKYELCCHPHIHLICEQCGKVEDLHYPYEPLMQNCAQESGYALRESSIAMIGVCPACQSLNGSLPKK